MGVSRLLVRGGKQRFSLKTDVSHESNQSLPNLAFSTWATAKGKNRFGPLFGAQMVLRFLPPVEHILAYEMRAPNARAKPLGFGLVKAAQ